MANNPDPIKDLYEFFKSRGDLGTPEEFREYMANPENRKEFYNYFSKQEDVDFGSQEEFDAYLGKNDFDNTTGLVGDFAQAIGKGTVDLVRGVMEMPRVIEAGIRAATDFESIDAESRFNSGQITKDEYDGIRLKRQKEMHQSLENSILNINDTAVGETLGNWSNYLEEQIPRRNKSLSEMVNERDYYGILRETVIGVGESLPISLSAALFPPARALPAIGVATAGMTFNQLDEQIESGELDLETITLGSRFLDAVGNGVAEVVGESFTSVIGAPVRRAIRQGRGLDEIMDAGKKSIMTDLSVHIERAGVKGAAAVEGLSEVATTMMQNTVDRETGIDPDRATMDNVGMSFLVGAAFGAGFKGVGNAYVRSSDRSRMREAIQRDNKAVFEEMVTNNLATGKLSQEEADAMRQSFSDGEALRESIPARYRTDKIMDAFKDLNYARKRLEKIKEEKRKADELFQENLARQVEEAEREKQRREESLKGLMEDMAEGRREERRVYRETDSAVEQVNQDLEDATTFADAAARDGISQTEDRGETGRSDTSKQADLDGSEPTQDGRTGALPEESLNALDEVERLEQIEDDSTLRREISSSGAIANMMTPKEYQQAILNPREGLAKVKEKLSVTLDARAVDSVTKEMEASETEVTENTPTTQAQVEQTEGPILEIPGYKFLVQRKGDEYIRVDEDGKQVFVRGRHGVPKDVTEQYDQKVNDMNSPGKAGDVFIPKADGTFINKETGEPANETQMRAIAETIRLQEGEARLESAVNQINQELENETTQPDTESRQPDTPGTNTEGLSQDSEATQEGPEVQTETEAVEDVSEEEYNNFVDNNTVTEERVSIIADKIASNIPLSGRETAMRNSASQRVEDALQQRVEAEDSQTTNTQENAENEQEVQEDLQRQDGEAVPIQEGRSDEAEAVQEEDAVDEAVEEVDGKAPTTGPPTTPPPAPAMPTPAPAGSNPLTIRMSNGELADRLGLEFNTDRKTIEALIQEARDEGLMDTSVIEDRIRLALAEGASERDRILTTKEELALGAYIAQLEVDILRLKSALDAVGNSSTPEAISLQQQIDSLEYTLRRAAEAMYVAGTELGRAQGVRSYVLAAELDADKIIKHWRRSAGRPLTPEELAEARRYSKEAAASLRILNEAASQRELTEDELKRKLALEILQAKRGKPKNVAEQRLDLIAFLKSGNADLTERWRQLRAYARSITTVDDTLDTVVYKVMSEINNHSDLVDAFENQGVGRITEEELINAIASAPESLKRAASATTEKRQEVQSQAKKIKDMRERLLGIFQEAKDKNQKPPSRKLQSISKFLQRLKHYAATSSTYELSEDGKRVVKTHMTSDRMMEISELIDEITNAYSQAFNGTNGVDKAQLDKAIEGIRKYEDLMKLQKIEEKTKVLADQLARLEQGDETAIDEVAMPVKREVSADVDNARKKLQFYREKVREKALQLKLEGAASGYDRAMVIAANRIGNVYKEMKESTRTLITILDMSMVMMQGNIIGMSDPMMAARAYGDTFRLLNHSIKRLSDKLIGTNLSLNKSSLDFAREMFTQRVESSPYFALGRRYGLELSVPGDFSSAEEFFRSTFFTSDSKFLPARAIGNVKEVSEYAYITYLNLLRINTFGKIVESGALSEEAQFEQAAAFVNDLTGRAKVDRSTALVFNNFLFAPRLYWSRFKVLGQLLATPVRGAVTLNQMARGRQVDPIKKEMSKLYLKATAAHAALWSILGFLGGDFEWDPRETDFAKIKFGDVAFDFTAGIGQYPRVLARALHTLTPETKSMLDDVFGEKPTLSWMDREDPITITWNTFIRYKLHPFINSSIGAISGTDIFGNPYSDSYIKSMLAGALAGITPISAQQFLEPANTFIDSREFSELTQKEGLLKAYLAAYGKTVEGRTMLRDFLNIHGISSTDYNNAMKVKEVRDVINKTKASVTSNTKKIDPLFGQLGDRAKEYYKAQYKEELQDMVGLWIKKRVDAGSPPTKEQIQKYTKIANKHLNSVYAGYLRKVIKEE